MVPFGPNARARLCVFVRAAFADWVVLVESLEDVRSTASGSVFCRPLVVLALLLLAELLPATIFSAQLVSDTEEDRRAEGSEGRS